MADKSESVFSLAFQVRDYECDLQGVVNNAVYQNYLEHARHEYLLSRKVDFVEMSRQGLQLVLVKATLDYRRSLRPKDRFSIEVRAHMEGRLRLVFLQRIVKDDLTVVLEARMEGALLGPKGRPMASPELSEAICSPVEPSSRSSAWTNP